MKPEIKERWLVALRSGKYEKGQLTLRANIGEYKFAYCCLGVLCDLHKEDTKEGEWSEENVYITKNGKERDWLPEDVQKWAGIENGTGKFDSNDTEDTFINYMKNNFGKPGLALINDATVSSSHYDPTFNSVIKYIEKYF